MAKGRGVVISGNVEGLSKGYHGFHIHQEGELGNDCKDAKGHFNPLKVGKTASYKNLLQYNLTDTDSSNSLQKPHGNPHSLDRHVGDLGNILTLGEGYGTEVLMMDRLITLAEGAVNSIAGRAVVIHAGRDDLGRGGDDGSLKTGNAGARVACGVIRMVDYY